MKQTQKDIVVELLLKNGEVDNFWAIHNYVLRLGAIIHTLSKEGWKFDTSYGKGRGYDRPLWKNYYYIVKEKPEII